jgi:hypothetical protein
MYSKEPSTDPEALPEDPADNQPELVPVQGLECVGFHQGYSTLEAQFVVAEKHEGTANVTDVVPSREQLRPEQTKRWFRRRVVCFPIWLWIAISALAVAGIVLGCVLGLRSSRESPAVSAGGNEGGRDDTRHVIMHPLCQNTWKTCRLF